MFLDMHILIPDGAAELQNKLAEIKKSGLLWIPLNDIKMHLNGVGRIIQYFNPFPDHLIDFSNPIQNYVWSLFEGQISNGIAHEFARIIYGDTGKSYCGFYNLGNKEGQGI